MGYSHWSDEAYRDVAKARSGKSRGEIFKGASKMHPTMEPKGVQARESRDSEDHPDSRAIIVGFDVTGSMGDIPERFAREKLGGLMKMLVERKYVADPQLLFAAIGDAVSDQAPLQIGQFESGLEMDMWLTRMWLEGRGGDIPESYTLAHWFAANHTSVDCWEKRKRKGYLFTIGDAPAKPLSSDQVHKVFGYPTEADTSNEAVIKAASAAWEAFHVHVTRGRPADQGVVDGWRALLGDRLLLLDHTDAICELIGVTIGVMEGTLSLQQASSDLADAGVGAVATKAILGTVEAAAHATAH